MPIINDPTVFLDFGAKGRTRVTFRFDDDNYDLQLWYNAEVYTTPECLTEQIMYAINGQTYTSESEMVKAVQEIVSVKRDADDDGFKVYEALLFKKSAGCWDRMMFDLKF